MCSNSINHRIRWNAGFDRFPVVFSERPEDIIALSYMLRLGISVGFGSLPYIEEAHA